jgi:hypothetical protein
MTTATSDRRNASEHARRSGRDGNAGAVSVNGLREFFNSTAGKAVAIVLILAGLVAIWMSVRSNFGPSDAVSSSRNRMFICSQTMKPFQHEVSLGEQFPVMSPFSGKNTGYPAEPCWWTKDGKIRTEPYYVLLNDFAHKSGPTFCPDCGRLVIPHNPAPRAGDRPPPTQQQYAERER